jgi:OmpA-OmpF porin, OOP family
MKQIAAMLTGHPELRIRIEGHTDNVGVKETNRSLSAKRAASVKAALVKDYAIAANRLDAQGLGDTKPVDKNDTVEGRQNNRRVELVKL